MNNTLGERMKSYEKATNYIIAPRLPVIIRIDGKAFHTLTKRIKCKKPFDNNFLNNMAESARFISSQIQGCILSYVQSDEASFVIRSDQSNETEPWFGNRIQKIISITSSGFSAVFNKNLNNEDPIAMFDCRIWYVPNMIEVANYFLWRQQDCVKNSISSASYYEIARTTKKDGSNYGKKTTIKMLHNLNQKQRQELLFTKANINWNDYPAKFKRGVIIFNKDIKVETNCGFVIRKKWVIEEAPNFNSEGKIWLSEKLNIKEG